jgi:ABC-type polysaccharide/polyol phosphate export permease
MQPSPNILSSFGAAVRAWPIWLWFARLDIRARYRESLLGPIWLALNLATLSIGMGIVYGAVFGMPLSEYIPYLTTGFMVWWFLSNSLNESCTAFTANDRLIRNQRLPLGIYVLRNIKRKQVIGFL